MSEYPESEVIAVTVYRWECPECGFRYEEEEPPKSEDEFTCEACAIEFVIK